MVNWTGHRDATFYFVPMELKSRYFQPIEISKSFSAHKNFHSAYGASKEHSILVVIAELFFSEFLR